jgi:hypothetical protein
LLRKNQSLVTLKTMMDGAVTRLSASNGGIQTMSKLEGDKSNGRGGFRPGAGRPRNVPLTPIGHLLGVMRNPKAEPARRDQAAIALLPYYHATEDEPVTGTTPLGKKADIARRAARVAASGRFATPQPPPRLDPDRDFTDAAR